MKSSFTWAELAELYRERTGSSALIRPMHEVFEWAQGQPDIEGDGDGGLRMKAENPDG